MISKCRSPRNPQRKPKPSAIDVSGSKNREASFSCSFSRASREETVFSEKLLEWNGKVQILRNIYAVESLVIKKYNLPYSDALLTVKNFMESDECNDWFNGICSCYLENKQQEKQIKAHMTDIMEKEL